MKKIPSPASAAMLFTLFGVTIGVAVVALTSREVRNVLKSTAHHLGGRAGELDEDSERIEAAFV